MAKAKKRIGTNTIQKLQEEAMEGLEQVETGGTIQDAIKMVQEMCSNTSPLSLSKQLGLAYPTVTNLFKGKGQRISDNVYQAISSFYSDWKSGKVQIASGRKRNVSTVSTGIDKLTRKVAHTGIDKKTLESELRNLEEKVLAIRNLLKLY